MDSRFEGSPPKVPNVFSSILAGAEPCTDRLGFWFRGDSRSFSLRARRRVFSLIKCRMVKSSLWRLLISMPRRREGDSANLYLGGEQDPRCSPPKPMQIRVQYFGSSSAGMMRPHLLFHKGIRCLLEGHVGIVVFNSLKSEGSRSGVYGNRKSLFPSTVTASPMVSRPTG